jgi:hypothetical protein
MAASDHWPSRGPIGIPRLGGAFHVVQIWNSRSEPSAHGTIEVRETTVEISVSDHSKSVEWYSRLLGKGPDLEPFPGNVEFKIGGAWLQIAAGDVKPSSWGLRVEVRELTKERERP